MLSTEYHVKLWLIWKKFTMISQLLTCISVFFVMEFTWARRKNFIRFHQISIGFLYQDTVPCSFAEKFYIFIAERDQENSWGNQGGLLICSEEVNCRFWWGISIKQTDSLPLLICTWILKNQVGKLKFDELDF